MIESNSKHQPNGSAEDISLGILHDMGTHWVGNTGTKKKPAFQVYTVGVTHSTSEGTAYPDITLAVARCNYLAKNSKQKTQA